MIFPKLFKVLSVVGVVFFTLTGCRGQTPEVNTSNEGNNLSIQTTQIAQTTQMPQMQTTQIPNTTQIPQTTQIPDVTQTTPITNTTTIAIPTTPSTNTTTTTIPTTPRTLTVPQETQTSKPQTEKNIDKEVKYMKISPKEAKEIIDTEKDIVILDVRTLEEYTEKHIPGSILIPYDVIESEAPSKLTDKSKKILIYCRSGRRSAIAAESLIKMGYTGVFDFGGIMEWPYEVEKGSPN